jgi:hypothetical protein
MATNRTNESIVIVSFSTATEAEDAIDALHAAGFTSDQIRYSRQFKSEDFLTGVKDLLIFPDERQDESLADIRTMLLNMGLGPDEIDHYEQSFRSGNFIVVVRPDGRDQQVRDLLKQHGGTGYTQ